MSINMGEDLFLSQCRYERCKAFRIILVAYTCLGKNFVLGLPYLRELVALDKLTSRCPQRYEEISTVNETSPGKYLLFDFIEYER